MLSTHTTALSTMRTVILAVLAAVLVAACGLGMDSEARVQRAQAAFDNAEYRAAMIDARNVLLDEPENVAARILLGKSAIEIGDGVSAEKELRRALDLGADHQGVIVELGRALLLQGKFDDVLTEITADTATSDSVRLAVLRIRGDAFIGLRQPEAARESYEAVLRADSDDVLAQLGVVNSFIVEQNFEQARETLNQILTFDDSFVGAWLTSGSLSMLARNVERAASDYQRAANLARQNSDTAQEMQALSGLANAVLAQRDEIKAELALSRMLEIAENDTRTLLISARLASVNGNWTKAQGELQEVLRRIPDYRPAQLLLGIAHKESGNLSQAEMYLSAVVAAAPNNADARRLLAETRMQLGEVDEARQTLAPIIDEPDADLNSLSMAARASLMMGEFGDATELLERGVAADPGNIDLQLQLAFAYFRAGNAERARNILRALPAAANERNEIQRDSLLILTQMAQGSLEDALQNARALEVRWPDRPESQILVGSIQMATGDSAAARKSFSAAAKLAPENPTPIRYLAQLDELDGNSESARVRYLEILGMQPKDVQSMVSLARLAAVGESYEESRDWLEKASDADPRARTPRRILAALHLAFGDFAAAEAVAEESLDIEQDDAYLYDLVGQAQFNRDDLRGAELSFEKAIELDRDQPSYRLNLAQTQAKRGNTASAIATLSEPPGKYLEHLPSAVLLASLKANSGAADEAAQIAAKLKQLHPDSAAPYALEAELLVRGGDLVAAAKLYDQAMSIQISDRYAIRAYQLRVGASLEDPVEPLLAYLDERPLDNNVRSFLAQSYQSMRDFDKSITEYEQVLTADPDNFVILNNLAWNYLESGDSRAEATARRAYEIEPENSSVMDTLGWILIRNGELNDGITMLRQAVEKGGDRPEVLFHLAAGLATSGEAEDAKIILTEILATEDSFSSRQEAEELLSTL